MMNQLRRKMLRWIISTWHAYVARGAQKKHKAEAFIIGTKVHRLFIGTKHLDEGSYKGTMPFFGYNKKKARRLKKSKGFKKGRKISSSDQNLKIAQTSSPNQNLKILQKSEIDDFEGKFAQSLW